MTMTSRLRTAAPGAGRRRAVVTERAGSERLLAALLCAPAVLVILAVTGYPIGYASYLSVERFDLRFPDQRGFVGLADYGAEGEQASTAELDELAADAGTAGVPSAGQLVTRLSAASAATQGDKVQVWFDPDQVQIFDPSDGRNLTLAPDGVLPRAAPDLY